MKLIIDIPDYKLDEVQNGSIASSEILKAVRKGTPVSNEGDLISREALKEIFLQDRCGDNFLPKHYVISTIDSAPTVELTEEQAIDKLHETGWLIRHDKEMTERPQGEWIRKCNEHRVDICCTNCGYDEGYSCFKYCPNCGADMRGKEE